MITKSILNKLKSKENDKLILEYFQLIERIEKNNQELRKENEKLMRENAELRKEILELKSKLSKTSHNSHKSPSSDGFNRSNAPRLKSEKKIWSPDWP